MNNQVVTRMDNPVDKWIARRERFMRDPLPVRLGELASALSTAKSAAAHSALGQVTRLHLDESAHYLEWTWPDVDPDWQAELAELRQLLNRWLANWEQIWDDPDQRMAVALIAGDWSQKVLERSSLLDYDDWREVFKPGPASSAAIAGQGMQ